jgi:hypothetical protein
MSSHSNLTFATLCLLKLYVHIKTRNKRLSSNEKLAMETVKEHEVTSLLVRDSSPLQSITPSWRALLAAACPCNYFYISVCLWGTNCLDEVKFSLDVQSRSVSECLTGNSSFAPLFYICYNFQWLNYIVGPFRRIQLGTDHKQNLNGSGFFCSISSSLIIQSVP